MNYVTIATLPNTEFVNARKFVRNVLIQTSNHLALMKIEKNLNIHKPAWSTTLFEITK